MIIWAHLIHLLTSSQESVNYVPSLMKLEPEGNNRRFFPSIPNFQKFQPSIQRPKSKYKSRTRASDEILPVALQLWGHNFASGKVGVQKIAELEFRVSSDEDICCKDSIKISTGNFGINIGIFVKFRLARDRAHFDVGDVYLAMWFCHLFPFLLLVLMMSAALAVHKKNDFFPIDPSGSYYSFTDIQENPFRISMIVSFITSSKWAFVGVVSEKFGAFHLLKNDWILSRRNSVYNCNHYYELNASINRAIPRCNNYSPSAKYMIEYFIAICKLLAGKSECLS